MVINWLVFCIRICVVLTIASVKNFGIIALIPARHCMGGPGDVPDDSTRVIMADEDEIILVDLDDDELVQQMHDDLYDGMQEEIIEGVEILLARDWTPRRCSPLAKLSGRQTSRRSSG